MTRKAVAGKYITLHCPHCGHRHTLFIRFEELIPPEQDTRPLSQVAFKILNVSGPQPSHFRNGGTVSLRQWQKLTGYSPSQVFAALRELKERGLVSTIPYGRKGRVQYVGVPERFEQFPHAIAA